MEYLVTASEMRQADENTITYFGVPQLVLMERAALSARDAMLESWPELFGRKTGILIALGNGNNGGDGAALARLFFLHGCDVTVLVSGEKEKYSEALKKQMEILEKYADNGSQSSGSLKIITAPDFAHNTFAGNGYDLIVDALFGIGLSREITGAYRKKIEWLNSLSGKKAALDIPSGISADHGSVLGCCFRADLTVTFGFLKRGMLLYPGRELCGKIIVADIGITEESFLEKYPAGMTWKREEGTVSRLFPLRKADSHKGSYGKILLIAGSADTPGAALLSGEAVLRSGAGMLQMVSPAENRELILSILPETMYQCEAEHTNWEKLLDWCDAVVMGPGVGQHSEAADSLERVLTLLLNKASKGVCKPLILDADALNLTAFSEKILGKIREYTSLGGSVIMTPHMAELTRLLHCTMPELKADRMGKIEEYCKENGVILISKDAATVVGYCGESGTFHYYINQTGNSGMATAGSGDVLSGILGALVAWVAVQDKECQDRGCQDKDCQNKGCQDKDCQYKGDSDSRSFSGSLWDIYFRAACRAVYLHGLAGDAAAERYGMVSMKAGDIIKELPKLLKGI